MKVTLIYQTSEDPYSAWGNLKAACAALGLSYHTAVKHRLPFRYGQYSLHSVTLYTGTDQKRDIYLNK